MLSKICDVIEYFYAVHDTMMYDTSRQLSMAANKIVTQNVKNILGKDNATSTTNNPQLDILTYTYPYHMKKYSNGPMQLPTRESHLEKRGMNVE